MDESPSNPESVLAELDKIRSGLSQALEALSEEELEAFMLEAEAFLASVEFESQRKTESQREAERPPWANPNL